jgi:hypothetical protein
MLLKRRTFMPQGTARPVPTRGIGESSSGISPLSFVKTGPTGPVPINIACGSIRALPHFIDNSMPYQSVRVIVLDYD